MEIEVADPHLYVKSFLLQQSNSFKVDSGRLGVDLFKRSLFNIVVLITKKN